MAGDLPNKAFGNLSALNFTLGNSTMRTTGFRAIDYGGDDAYPAAATTLTKNCVHVIGGDLSGGAVTVTLPTGAVELADIHLGDFFTFLIGASSTATGGHVIACGASTDVMIGGLEYIRIAAVGTATAASEATASTAAVYITPNQDTTTDHLISLDANEDHGGGSVGSYVTCTYLGTPQVAAGTSKYTWFISGKIYCVDVNAIGSEVFDAS